MTQSLSEHIVSFFRTRPRLTVLSLLVLALAILGIFFLLPLLIMFIYSFAQRGTYGGVAAIASLWDYVISFAWAQNYLRSVESIYLAIFARSLWMAALATLLCLMVSYPIAYYISIKVRPSRKNLLLTLVVIPFWTSFLIRTYAWIVMLRTEGWINSFLLGIGIIHEPLPLLFTNYAILVGLVYGELPFMILPLYVSLEKLDLSLLEAAKDLGANSFWTFWKVTVPLTMPGIVAGIVLVFIPSIGAFVVPDLLGGAKGMLVGNLIQNQFLVARNKPFGSAVAFALTAFVLVVLYGYARFAKRRGEALI